MSKSCRTSSSRRCSTISIPRRQQHAHSANRNDPNGLVIVQAYQCTSCPVKRQLFNPPNNTNGPSDLIPPNTGSPAAVAHYYGINGPRGSNYPVGTALHEGVPAATSGIFQRDGTIRMARITDGTSNTIMIAEMSWVSPLYGTRFRTWVRGGDEYAGIVAGKPAFVVSCRNVTNPINGMLNGEPDRAVQRRALRQPASRRNECLPGRRVGSLSGSESQHDDVSRAGQSRSRRDHSSLD